MSVPATRRCVACQCKELNIDAQQSPARKLPGFFYQSQLFTAANPEGIINYKSEGHRSHPEEPCQVDVTHGSSNKGEERVVRRGVTGDTDRDRQKEGRPKKRLYWVQTSPCQLMEMAVYRSRHPVPSGTSSLLGEFNKEQEAFIKEKQGKNSDAAVPPWVGCPNENSLKEECLTLSTDRRNFVRSPPAGVEFQFDYEVTYPVAMATLAEDPNLEKMRFELVPKVINEETFWRNYFYRISLIRQANELSSMAESQVSSRINSMEGEPAVNPRVDDVLSTASDSPAHEFVSDTFRATSSDLEEVREGMKKLGMDPDKRNEEEWEKELEAELQDYEVVADGEGNIHQDSNWENQIDELLDAEHISDLK
uniref:BSD domain-containing protein n=4 Tax=Timema TaxID=61471 RepID=A0A7R9EBD6_9NEOP|nr:unnamed protein product [Timema monikensis]